MGITDWGECPRPVGTLIKQSNALEASLGYSGYGGPRLRLPAPNAPQVFGGANLVASPSPCNHHGYLSTDIFDYHGQPCSPGFVASLCGLSVPRSPDTVGVMVSPPHSPSNIEGSRDGLFRLSKESKVSADGKERLKRLKHTRKEQDRRKKNKAETDRLRDRVPECDSQTPKAEVLARANDYIEQLERQLREMIERIRAMEGRSPSAE